jgi:hypothetical protein
MQIKPHHQVPVSCPECGTQGWYGSEDPSRPALVVCGNCGARTSDTFCPKCRCRGPFVELIEPSPSEFRCRLCGAVQELPRGFWKQPRRLEQGAPVETVMRQQLSATTVVLIAATLVVAILMIYNLLAH